MAVAGLPEPREDHAVVMCRFANECLERMNFLSRKLEVHLGPDTAGKLLHCKIYCCQLPAFSPYTSLLLLTTFRTGDARRTP